ncbi:MAG: tetratricopeptide repeat protein [Rhizobiaceae bacterium]|nr:tetratricopeptide repeat protein [Rhizobiaceae bacterium]
MSDDSFIREVNEELRTDNAKALWDRYGAYVVAIAIALVVGTGAWVAWDYWTQSRANTSGDQFSQALDLAKEGKTDEALAVLQTLEAEGYGSYPQLARLRRATVLAQQDKPAEAIAEFDAVVADSSVPEPVRDMARLRAGYLLVDHGSYADVSSRVEALTAETNALRHSAREALGLSAWKEGRAADALTLFEQIASDVGAPRNARERATLMAELIRGSGTGS